MSNNEPMAVVYRGRSNYERKGVAELEQLGVSAFTPYDESGKRAKVTAPGYIFANRAVNAAFLKHVRGKPLGHARLSAIANLHVRKPPPPPPPPPAPAFEAGNAVMFKDGPFADKAGILSAKRGRRQWLVSIGDRQVCAQTSSLIRIDPG